MRRFAIIVVAVVLVAASGCTADKRPAAQVSASPRPVAVGSAIELPALTASRAGHTATLLADGRVLIVGGCSLDGCEGMLAGAEFYEPTGRRFVAGPAMRQPRAGHTASPLPDGRVLVLGGYPAEGRGPLRQAEVFDPRSGGFAPAGEMASGRGAHTATRLADGRVLITGGVDGARALSAVELFDPATNTFRPAAPLPGPRATHGAALLRDGRVLIAGGQSGVGHGNALLDTAVVYDPAADIWTPTAPLTVAKYKLAIASLPDGGAIVIGGQTADEAAARLASTELFSPRTGRFTAGPVMAEPRYKISDAIVVLRDGRVVASGGFGAEVYAAGRFNPISGTPRVERQFPAAVALADGTVLVTGGYDDRTRVTGTAFLINPG
jgi:hypothetical protein